MLGLGRRVIVGAGALGLVAALLASDAWAGGGYAYGGGYAAGCGPQYQTVQKTIYVPQMVPETRMVNVTEYHTEVRQRTVTVHRQVPETRQVVENFIVMVPQKRSNSRSSWRKTLWPGFCGLRRRSIIASSGWRPPPWGSPWRCASTRPMGASRRTTSSR